MQIEAVGPRMPSSVFGWLALLARVAQATKASASMRPERYGALHRRRRQPGQHRGVVRPRVRRGSLVVALLESAPIEQALDARLHPGQHLVDIQGRQATCGVKVQGAGRVPPSRKRRPTRGHGHRR